MVELKVRKEGSVLVIEIPVDVAEAYDIAEGDVLTIAPEAGGLSLQPGKERLQRQLACARAVMDENAEALDLLAR